MARHSTCRFYILSGERSPEGVELHRRKPLRVVMDERPTVVRYRQRIKLEGSEGDKVIELQGYFKREGADEYRQLTTRETERLLQWMSNHDTAPETLLMDDVERALKAPLIHSPNPEKGVVTP